MDSNRRGKFIIIFGPTGSGKGVLISHIREMFPEMVFPTSVTTREKRPGPENNSYRFISVQEFERMRDEEELLEWAQFGHNYYGTVKHEVTDALKEGKLVLKEMEVQGVRQVLDLLPADEVVTIYIDAGSWDELERRVRSRAPITEAELEKRKKRYEDEVSFKDNAQFVVRNYTGELEKAKDETYRLIKNAGESIRA